jgi:hypothetical protein
MEMPDLNHTLLLTIAVLVSLTRLVRLLFVALRVCVKEYCEFRDWLRAYAARRRKKEMGDAQSPQQVTPGANRPPAPTAIRQ